MALLSRSELRKLLEHREEWCVSIFMPTHRAGAEIQQDSIRLKNLLGDVEVRLVEGGLRRPEAQELLEPAYGLVPQHDFWRHQSDGLALFVSPTLFRPDRLPFDFEALTVVAGWFHLKPLLPLLAGDGRFYVLALSQNEIRLLQGTRYSVGQVDLDQVPERLADILKWDDPEKRLQWHTRTGSKVDGRAAIFHGHGVASADDPKDYILRYFHRVNEGLSRLLADERAPMVLAGVDYLLPIYQQANTYPHLLSEGITGNPEELSAQELHEHAWSIIQPLFHREQQDAAARYQRLAGANSQRASSVVPAVVSAAYHGRVAILFVSLGQQQWGSFEPATNTVHKHEEAKPGDEDLLDFAAVHTYLNGGEVYAVEPQQVPDDAPLAAVFRY
jgi:hypothetical protein